MQYHTVYDAAGKGFNWVPPFLMLSLGLLAGGTLWGACRLTGKNVLRVCSRLDTPGGVRSVTLLTMGGFGLLMAITFVTADAIDYCKVRNAIATRGYSSVEGAVSNFVPYRPLSSESFSINGVHFEYSNAEWDKGALHDGTRARVTYLSDMRIVKVETE